MESSLHLIVISTQVNSCLYPIHGLAACCKCIYSKVLVFEVYYNKEIASCGQTVNSNVSFMFMQTWLVFLTCGCLISLEMITE